MLNMLSDLEAAAAARTSFGAGACLRLGAVRTAQPHTGPALSGRARAFWASDVFGQRRAAAGLGVALGQPGPYKPYKPNNYMARIAAASGGAKGPHPAREPEPA
jgi:hypothetical protein